MPTKSCNEDTSSAKPKVCSICEARDDDDELNKKPASSGVVAATKKRDPDIGTCYGTAFKSNVSGFSSS